MEIRITVGEDAGKRAEEMAQAIGASLEQVIAAYVHRIADGTELLESDLFPDGTPRPRTLRQQMYRFGA